jgi:hypothetical protein
MIAKTFFLAKIIHRIGARIIRQEKSLLENKVENQTFFVLGAIRRAEFCITLMGLGHLDRLRRARDLLSVKKHRAADAILACYSGAGFTAELTAAAAADPHVLLVDLKRLYQEPDQQPGD